MTALETLKSLGLRRVAAVLPALRPANGGYIVNISSLAGIVGLPFSGLFCHPPGAGPFR